MPRNPWEAQKGEIREAMDLASVNDRYTSADEAEQLYTHSTNPNEGLVADRAIVVLAEEVCWLLLAP